MRMKSFLGTTIVIIVVATLILSYRKSGTYNASADVSRSISTSEINNLKYDINHIKLSNDRLNINENITPKYYSTEKELVSIFVSDLDIDEPKYKVTDEEREILYRIVEAEVTGGDIESKKNVASAIINRVNSSSFPNDIESVVFQKYQFSSVGHDGRYYKVEITEETIQAVDEVLQDGVIHNYIYFFNLRDVESTRIKNWINKKLVFGFTDTVGHSYYNER